MKYAAAYEDLFYFTFRVSGKFHSLRSKLFHIRRIFHFGRLEGEPTETLYEVGEKVAGVYPEGRYIAIKVRGKIHDHYIIVGVLNMPSMRAAANPEAWSGAVVKPYGSMVSFERGGMIKEPKVYEGMAGTEAGDYIDSLREAAGKMREAYIDAGDEEAAFRTIKTAYQAIRNEERILWKRQNSGKKNVKSVVGC